MLKGRKKGHNVSKETRDKISKAQMGRIPWNKGKTNIYSEETLKKMSRAKKDKSPANKKFESAREGQLYRCYGIMQKDFNKMFENQNGCCSICGKHQSKLSKPLCVDHNHKTGQIRNLLCNMCNTFLGVYNEDPKEFKKFNSYIKKWSNASIKGEI